MTEFTTPPIVRIPRVQAVAMKDQIGAPVALMLTGAFFVGAIVAAIYALYTIPFT